MDLATARITSTRKMVKKGIAKVQVETKTNARKSKKKNNVAKRETAGAKKTYANGLMVRLCTGLARYDSGSGTIPFIWKTIVQRLHDNLLCQ